MSEIARGQDPVGRDQWQEAVDLAHAHLAIVSARSYGLIEGGPEIDVARCEELLERGKRMGIVPSADAIETVALHYARGGEDGGTDVSA